MNSGAADVATWNDAAPDVAAAKQWLRTATSAGNVGGPWTAGFPRYVWHQADGSVYEYRLAGRQPGQYTVYLLHPSEWPEGLT